MYTRRFRIVRSFGFVVLACPAIANLSCSGKTESDRGSGGTTSSGGVQTGGASQGGSGGLTGGSGGSTGGTGNSGGTQVGEGGICFSGAKVCPGPSGELVCSEGNDPQFGCASVTCSPCQTPHASAACSDGACAIWECYAGFADCNGDPADGCETYLAASPENCGACGIACAPGTPCVEGNCQ